MKKFLTLIMLSAIVSVVLPVTLLKENLAVTETPFTTEKSITEPVTNEDTITVFRSVNQDNLEINFFEYVCGSVAAEMPLSYHEEAQ